MNLIQSYNMFTTTILKLYNELHSMAWWKELITVWIISIIFVRIIIPVLNKYIFSYPLRKRTGRIIDSFCNRNLKPNVIFLDHAPIPGLYVLNKSVVSFEPNDVFIASTEFLNKIDQNRIDKYRIINHNSDECYGVKFFSYNRLQEVEADEAHWFNISLYKTDCFTKAMLKTWLNKSEIKDIKPSEPITINKLFPFVLEFRIAIHVYYKKRFGNYCILSNNLSGFIVEHVITANDITQKNGGLFLIDIVNKLLLSHGFIAETQINDNGCFTDFALDYKNMVLYLIGNVQISKPLRGPCYSKNDIKKIRNKIIKREYTTEYQEMFLYSSSNLFSRIANNNKHN